MNNAKGDARIAVDCEVREMPVVDRALAAVRRQIQFRRIWQFQSGSISQQ
jgi:hypothetical protein